MKMMVRQVKLMKLRKRNLLALGILPTFSFLHQSLEAKLSNPLITSSWDNLRRYDIVRGWWLASKWNLVYAQNILRTAFRIFSLCVLLTFAPQRTANARKIGFILKPRILHDFLCSKKIYVLLVPPKCCFLPFFDTPRCFRPNTGSTDEATSALNSCHSTSAFSVHSGISQNDVCKSLSHVFDFKPPTAFGRTSWSCTFV